MKILIADDERDMAAAPEAMLRQQRYAADTIYNGRAQRVRCSGLYSLKKMLTF